MERDVYKGIAAESHIIWCDSEEERVEREKEYRAIFDLGPGIDVYGCVDFSCPGRKRYVPKGAGRSHYSATSEPIRTIENFDEFEFRLTDKVLYGVYFEPHCIAALDVDILRNFLVKGHRAEDDWCTWVDLRRLNKTQIDEVVQRLEEFLSADAVAVGETASVGVGGSHVVPWCRYFAGGELAYELDGFFRGVSTTSFMELWWDTFEEALPDGCFVRGDDGDGASWYIDQNSEVDCPHCAHTYTVLELENMCDGATCPECGDPFPEEAEEDDDDDEPSEESETPQSLGMEDPDD